MGPQSTRIVSIYSPRHAHKLIILNSANTLLSIDLSQNWTNTSVQIHSTSKPAGCISLNGPSLWYHEQENVLYSGFAGWQSNFDSDEINVNNISIWTFKPDGAGSGARKDIIPFGSNASTSVNRPEQAFQAFGGDSAWVLGGFDEYDPGQYPYLPSMVHFNMSSRTFTTLVLRLLWLRAVLSTMGLFITYHLLGQKACS